MKKTADENLGFFARHHCADLSFSGLDFAHICTFEKELK